MLNAQLTFQKNITQANELGRLYANLTELVHLPEQFEDLLRSQIVYAVSAFDKLIHDLVRIGMVEIFEGKRLQTPKYGTEAIALQHFPDLAIGAVPPPAVKFESLVRDKLSILSFQDPSKVSDGLSFIWNENQKWQKIAQHLGMNDTDAKRHLRLIITRRNAIVHEADSDPVTNLKQPISDIEASEAANYLLRLGNAICTLVV